MDLYSLIEAGGHFKMEVSSEDLCKFADRLINKAQEMKAHELAAVPTEETWLTAKEAAKKCMVSETTLWSWAKSGYLVPSKMGNKRLYALSEINALLQKRQG